MRRLKEILTGLIGLVLVLIIIEFYISGGGIVTPALTDYVEGIGRVRRYEMNYVMFNEGFSLGEFNKGR